MENTSPLIFYLPIRSRSRRKRASLGQAIRLRPRLWNRDKPTGSAGLLGLLLHRLIAADEDMLFGAAAGFIDDDAVAADDALVGVSPFRFLDRLFFGFGWH